MFKWSIATVCMGGTLEAKLAAAARAGFRAIEIFENDLTFFSGKPRDVRRMAKPCLGRKSASCRLVARRRWSTASGSSPSSGPKAT